MKKIVTIIGARPQIIKAAALSRAIKNHFSSEIKEVIVHTGQHYDDNMSEVFFRELGIPSPDYNLKSGSGSHGEQTAQMISGIEKILITEKPSALVLYGDTNSTLAGAIAGSKIQIPIVHIEAGLRSFNKSMPEEINRILCDHVSTLLFSPTQTGINNLKKEGFSQTTSAPFSFDNPKIYHCGDVMYDNSLYFSEMADSKSNFLQSLGVNKNEFLLATVHRNNNTDQPERLNAIITSLLEISSISNKKIIFPVHPRTKKCMDELLSKETKNKLINNPNFVMIPPASFLEMIALEKNASMVITDSGGVQKEAFYFEKPCLILRPETEWVELVEMGAALIVDADKDKIVQGYRKLSTVSLSDLPKVYGDGKAAEFICSEIKKQLF